MSRLKNAQSPGEPLPPCLRWVWGWAGLASRTNSKVNGNYDAGSVTLQHDRQRRPSFSYSLKGKKARIARRKQGLQIGPCRTIALKVDLEGPRDSNNLSIWHSDESL